MQLLNQAAWLTGPKKLLEVREAPRPSPGEGQIVLRNGAIAVNPVDWIKQDSGDSFANHIRYPFIEGSDVAGEVVQIGPGVTRFKVGDRVVGHAVGTNKNSNKSSEGAFQLYTVLRTNMASQIPPSMSYESACVLPLGFSTAACALFGKEFLALPYPTALLEPSDSSRTVLVWGASTSVGCNSIQLARASGCRVFATASPRNHGYLRELGAEQVFDYHDPAAANSIIAALSQRSVAGAIAIGKGSFTKCLEIMSRCEGNRFVAAASIDTPVGGIPKGIIDWPAYALNLAYENLPSELAQQARRVGAKFIYGSNIMTNEVSKAVYEDYLPQALAKGWMKPAPSPIVVGRGLENVQKAMDLNKQGISAGKVVISL